MTPDRATQAGSPTRGARGRGLVANQSSTNATARGPSGGEPAGCEPVHPIPGDPAQGRTWVDARGRGSRSPRDLTSQRGGRSGGGPAFRGLVEEGPMPGGGRIGEGRREEGAGTGRPDEADGELGRRQSAARRGRLSRRQGVSARGGDQARGGAGLGPHGGRLGRAGRSGRPRLRPGRAAAGVPAAPLVAFAVMDMRPGIVAPDLGRRRPRTPEEDAEHHRRAEHRAERAASGRSGPGEHSGGSCRDGRGIEGLPAEISSSGPGNHCQGAALDAAPALAPTGSGKTRGGPGIGLEIARPVVLHSGPWRNEPRRAASGSSGRASTS
jgi:hypothetical protein